MKSAVLALLFSTIAAAAQAEPTVVASGAYPEGLMWYGGRIYFTEMGADRVSVIDNGEARPFWHLQGCGPTQIVPFGPSGFVVDCHLGRAMVEVSAKGVTERRFTHAPSGERLQDPNAAVSDGQGGAYFSDSGIFDTRAPWSGRVYHLSAMGAMVEVLGGIHYANGVNFDLPTRTLYVSEHLSRRVLALTVDTRQRVTAKRVLIDFAKYPATRDASYELAGPDGIALRPGMMAIAEYGEGRVHLFDRDGRHLNTLKVPMPFVDTVIWDGSGNLYAGGSFQNLRPPFEGAVVRFSRSQWEQAP